MKNIDQQTAQTVTSITTVDLTGISHLEEAFAIVLVAAATAVFVLSAVAERRHEFATMTAIGASLREVGGVRLERGGDGAGRGALLAAGLGWLLARMLVAMLTHVFDPPPDHLADPVGLPGGCSRRRSPGRALGDRGRRAPSARLPLGRSSGSAERDDVILDTCCLAYLR